MFCAFLLFNFWMGIRTMHSSLLTIALAAAMCAASLPCLGGEAAPLAAQQLPTSFVSNGAHQIPYQWSEAKQAKATVVVVNGRTETFLKYQALKSELLLAGYNVLMFDHRGQGLSARYTADAHKGHIDDFQLYVDDLHQLLEALLPHPREQKLLFLAHSMGGAVTTLYLQQHPKVAAGAALLAPMLGIQGKIVFSENDSCAISSLVAPFKATGYAGFKASPYEAIPFRKENALTSSEVHYNAFQTLQLTEPHLQLGGPTWGWVAQSCAVFPVMQKQSVQLQVPVLLLQGELETVVSNKAHQRFCEELEKNPHSGCVTGKPMAIANAKHELLFESEPMRSETLRAVFDYFEHLLKR